MKKKPAMLPLILVASLILAPTRYVMGGQGPTIPIDAIERQRRDMEQVQKRLDTIVQNAQAYIQAKGTLEGQVLHVKQQIDAELAKAVQELEAADTAHARALEAHEEALNLLVQAVGEGKEIVAAGEGEASS